MKPVALLVKDSAIPVQMELLVQQNRTAKMNALTGRQQRRSIRAPVALLAEGTRSLTCFPSVWTISHPVASPGLNSWESPNRAVPRYSGDPVGLHSGLDSHLARFEIFTVMAPAIEPIN
jgi:hypothetical protein